MQPCPPTTSAPFPLRASPPPTAPEPLGVSKDACKANAPRAPHSAPYRGPAPPAAPLDAGDLAPAVEPRQGPAADRPPLPWTRDGAPSVAVRAAGGVYACPTDVYDAATCTRIAP